MKELNHLQTYESFTTNEEFNPLKKEDWRQAGHSIKKGMGFLTPEEELEAGKKMVLTHKTRSDVYNAYLNGYTDRKGKEHPADPKKAEAYLRFWGKSENDRGNPVWNGVDFENRAHVYAPAGSIGAGN